MINIRDGRDHDLARLFPEILNVLISCTSRDISEIFAMIKRLHPTLMMLEPFNFIKCATYRIKMCPTQIGLLLLTLQYDHNAHHSQHNSLQPRMLAQHNRDISNAWNIASYTPNDILFSIQVTLTSCVELRIVCNIVVTFCQQFGT